MDIKAGKKFLKEKNYIEAEKIFLNLIKHNNDLLLSNFYLGGIYFEMDNYDKSKLYYKKALKLKKDSKEVLVNLAYLEQSYGKLISVCLELESSFLATSADSRNLWRAIGSFVKSIPSADLNSSAIQLMTF